MKFGITYSTPYHGVDPDKIATFAQLAEECGFESIYQPEHIVLYPGATIGPYELPVTLPYADPLDVLTFVAASTRRILLGTAVLLLPYHHPVTLAKRLATIDQLSRGRMRLLTIGLGALPGEAQAVGVDYPTRGRRADEAIDALCLLWAGGPEGVTYKGEFFTLDTLVSYPKPYDSTQLPIHIGGSTRSAARRAGLRGDGYFPGGALTAEERTAQWHLAQTTAAEAGRDPKSLDYTRFASIDITRDHVESLAAEGVTRLVINSAATTADEQREELTTFATHHNLR
ncbi:TIGR03619 family F420-dependent LLM class oxidoreductase [Nonomuraea sp. NPDC050556]|uniref:TIGR03619 family F420-dependent LLM class oxidoreductase n=1 Tax=Nonomuraea sp. NPDC050556 TaxID=3364369 RepID=UPI0037AB14C0